MSSPASGVEPIPFSRLLDETMRVVRQNFRAIFVPVAVPLAVLSALFPIAQWAAQRPGFIEQPSIPLIVGLVVLFLMVMAVYLAGYGVLMVSAVDAAAGRPIDVAAALRRVVQPRLFGTLLLSGLGIMAGMLCCIVPGLYLVLLWSVALPVMVEEHVYGPGALGRSRDLMQYNPGGDFGNDPRFRAFIILFASAMLAYIASMLVQLPLMGVMFALIARSAASGAKGDPQALMNQLIWLQVPTQVLSTLTQIATQLFSAVGMAILFFEVRRRKEGLDLSTAIEGLERGPTAP